MLGPTTLVVPCYNERERLPVAELAAFTDRHGISLKLVNDGSSDGTSGVLEDVKRRSAGTVTVMNLERNVGKGEAVRLGMLRALEEGAEIVGYVDADLATPLAEMSRMVGCFEDPDLVAATGARVQLLGTRIERRALRHYAGRFFATAAAIVLDRAYYDTQCGAKLFRRSPRLSRALADPFASRWLFDVELLGRLLDPGSDPGGPSKVIEVPLAEWRDVSGSKVSADTFVRAPIDLAKTALALRRWRRSHARG